MTAVVLRDIDLGGTDAESDSRLDDDFIETSDVGVAIDGKEFVLLGRKGAGKSSLFRQVPTLVRSDRWAARNISVLNLTPDNYEWSQLTALEFPELPRESLLTTSWKLSLYLRLAENLIDGKWGRFARLPKEISSLRRLVIGVFGRPSVGESVIRRVLRLLDSFAEGNLKFGDAVSLSFKRRERAKPAVALLNVERELGELVRAALAEDHRYLIQVDRLDDAWDGSAETKTWLIGLLRAAKAMNDSFRKSPAASSPVKAIVYLRTDIYETLRFDDKDKLRSFEKEIRWNEEALTTMLEKRLPEGLSISNIFEQRPINRMQFPVQYFFEHTFLRPREVIQFLRECFSRTDEVDSAVSNSTLKAAEVVFSGWKVDDLKLEFAKANPELPALVEALRQGTHRYESLEAVEAEIALRAKKAVEELGPRRCLQLLFDASVIGVRLNESGKVRFRVNEPSLQLPAVASVYVHPALHRGLLIREARRARGAAGESI